MSVQLMEKVEYLITNYRTKWNLHLDKYNNVVVWSTGGEQASNQWSLKKEGEYYKIINSRSKLELHLAADNNIVGWHTGGDSNLWKIITPEDSWRYGEPWYVIENKRTGKQMHTTEDNRVVGWHTGQKGSNQWQFTIPGTVKLVKIEYDRDHVESKIEPQDLVTLIFNNDADTSFEPQWEEIYERERTFTHSWEWHAGYKYTLEVEMKVEVPEVVGMSIESTYEIDLSKKWGETTQESERKTCKFKLPSKVPPRRKYIEKVTISSEKVTIPFTAYYKAGGSEWQETGTYKGVQYSKIETDIHDVGPSVPIEPPVTVSEEETS